MKNKIINGDCLNILKEIAEAAINTDRNYICIEKMKSTAEKVN